MAKKKADINEPMPFKRLKWYNKNFPKIWDYCDILHNSNGELYTWDKKCELPISASLAVMDCYSESEKIDTAIFPAECAALYAWRKYKAIYNFDSDFAAELFEQAEDMEIPVDVLYSLPYPCIWIQADENFGFYVWIEDDVHTHIKELRMLVIDKDSGNEDFSNIILHLKQGWTIKDGIDSMMEACRKAQKNPDVIENERLYGKETLTESAIMLSGKYNYYVSSRLIQLVLYICAENKEITDNKQQKEITKRSKESETNPKDVFREVQKWDVGYRIGSAIRSYHNSSGSNVGHSAEKIRKERRASIRPHTRRGHYHHYWIGSVSDGSRRIVLKWIAPTYINGNASNVVPTIHQVNK